MYVCVCGSVCVFVAAVAAISYTWFELKFNKRN